MTECKQSEFEFASHFSRRVTADFEGGAHTSDGGLVLLREVAEKLRLMPRLGRCFRDWRAPERLRNTVEEMLGQRIFALAAGYEDLNDHDELRQDPLLAAPAEIVLDLDVTDTPLHGRQQARRRKTEQLAGKENPRYVATSLGAAEWPPRELYERLP